MLIDSIDAWFNVFNDTLRHFKLKTSSKKNFKKDFGMPIEYDVKKYFIGKSVKEIELEYNKYFTIRKNLVKLSPQSVYTLKNLKNDKKLKIGLISNSTKFIVVTVLNHFKLKKYFKIIVTMNDVKRGKPAPDMVLKACKTLKVSPKNTILVGDSINDIIAGKRAGCITIGYKIKGDYKIKNLNSITNYLNQKSN